jgi:hypothetical protein
MFVLNSSDNRIVTAALECLQVLLKFLPFRFNVFLTATGSMGSSFLLKKQLNILNFNIEKPTITTVSAVTTSDPLQATSVLTNDSLVQSPSSLIGQFYSPNEAPIDYLVRYLAFKFLINVDIQTVCEDGLLSKINKLKPDNQVKVLLKAIAFDCCSNLISLCPHLLFYTIYYDENKIKNKENIQSNLFQLFYYD